MPSIRRGRYTERVPPKPCYVIINKFSLARCGKANWGWTNYMEPICLEHFQQRLFLQRWMQIQQGHNWAQLIIRENPQGFLPLDESEDSQKRRNFAHIRKVQNELGEARERRGRT